jgi:hypothetical protein
VSVAAVSAGIGLRLIAVAAVAGAALACGSGDDRDGALDAPVRGVGGDMPYRMSANAQPTAVVWRLEIRHRGDQWCASNLLFNGARIEPAEPRCAESADGGATPAIELGRDGETRFYVIFADGLTQTGIDPGTADLEQPTRDPGMINADQEGPVILVVSQDGRPGEGIIVADDDGHQSEIPLPG